MKFDEIPDMTSFRPFMIEALYKWYIVNKMSPLLLVDCSQKAPGLSVPQIALDGANEHQRVLLDLAPDAVDDLEFGSFVKVTCYFDDGPETMSIPVSCIVGIYCQELPESGLFFDPSISSCSVEEYEMELEELREEERLCLQQQTTLKPQSEILSAKVNDLSRSKLKIVRPNKTTQDS